MSNNIMSLKENVMPFPEGRLLRLPGDMLLKLELHLFEHHRGVHFEDHLARLLTDWLNSEANRLAARDAADCRRGYQWKDVFLPDRSLLRTVVKGQNFVAEVRYDDLIYQNERTSPSRFANAHGVKGRNAWDSVWIKMPGNTEWTKAKALRPAPAQRGRSAN